MLPSDQHDKDMPRPLEVHEESEFDPRVSAALAWCRARGMAELTVAAPFRLPSTELDALLAQPEVSSILAFTPPPSATSPDLVGEFLPTEYTWRLPDFSGQHIVFIGGRDGLTARMIRVALLRRIKTLVFWDLDRWTQRSLYSLALHKISSRVWGVGQSVVSRASTLAAHAASRGMIGIETRLRGLRSSEKPSQAASAHPRLLSISLLQTPTRHRLNRLVSKRTRPLRISDRPMPNRIVMACPTLVAGGAERQIVNTAVGLRQVFDLNITVLVSRLFSPPGNDFFHRELTTAGVDVREVQSATSSAESWVQHQTAQTELLLHQLQKLLTRLPPELTQELAETYLMLRELRPAVLHAWLDHSSVCAGLAALMAGVPRVILSGRNVSPLHFSYILQPYMHPAYRAMDKRPETVFVNNSRGGADDYADWLGIDPDRFQVIYNGVDLDVARDTSPERIRDLRLRHRIPDQALLVGGMFRLSAEKRPLLWIDTLTELAKQRADVFGLLFGAGPMEPELRARLEHGGVAERIILAPPIKDSATALAAFDILLLTSRWEGTPNVAIEAQAAGTPVVVSGGGGAAEALDHGKTGLFVEHSSNNDLVAALIALADDGDLRQRLGDKGPAFVGERFGLQRMLSETMQLYGISQSEARTDGNKAEMQSLSRRH